MEHQRHLGPEVVGESLLDIGLLFDALLPVGRVGSAKWAPCSSTATKRPLA